MNTYVLDTSVAVAWYLEEVFSLSARVWQDRMLEGKVLLVVPSLHYWEFANVLRTLTWRRELEEDLAREILDLHLEAPLEQSDPDRRTVLDTALDFGATVYDAVFITLCLSRGLPLITAEKTTTAWVARLRDHVEPVR
jgi:predicted nucleic acid-binding protein